jgi:hypothetical protein
MAHDHYVVNLDKQEYLVPAQLGDEPGLMTFTMETGGIMTALAILLAVSNGRGGGDLNCDDAEVSDLIGSWGGDHIEITERVAAGWTDLSPATRKLIAADGYFSFAPRDADHPEGVWTRLTRY